MKRRTLTVKEREAYGKKITKMIEEITGATNMGIVHKASIKLEVNEPLEIEMTLYF